MSRREEAKAFTRARICATAEEIVRSEGIEQLNMRRLAEQAGVSLRTPYNLFGSKTDVLIALLDEAEFQLAPLASLHAEGSAITQLLGALSKIETFFARDEEYYRGIYAAVMSSDHQAAREAGVQRAVTTAQALLAQAVARGELCADTDTPALGRHLGIVLLAVLGMWGSGFFANRESIAQVRRAWLAALLQHAGEETRSKLLQSYRQACGSDHADDR